MLAAARSDSITECFFPENALVRPSIAATLNIFRHEAMAVINFACDGDSYQLFHTSAAEPARLTTLGITTRLLHTSTQVFLRAPAHTLLSACVAAYKEVIPSSRMDLIIAGKVRLKMDMFDGSKPIQCRRHLYARHSYVRLKHKLLPSGFALPAPCSVFHCPEGHFKAAAYPFSPSRQHKSIRCKERCAPIRSKLRHCPCNRSWHECSTHSPIGRLHDVLTNRPARRPRATSSTTRQTSTLAQLTTLEPNTLSTRAITGPILKARFPHLANPASRGTVQAGPNAGRDIG